MSEWIKNLKVGDMVIISTRMGESIGRVDRITKAGNIGVGSSLFRPDGIERGCDTWNIRVLREATPEAVNRIKRADTIKKAYNLMRNATGINFEQATKIIEILSL